MAKKQFYIPQVEDNEQEQEQVFSSDGSKTKYESLIGDINDIINTLGGQ